MPDPALQELWNGASPAPALARQSAAFYRDAPRPLRQAGERPLGESRVLDFGCGWGRLTRFLARDVPPGRLYGCDPVGSILDVCRDERRARDARPSDFVPERLPFDGPFDLAFAFSVFTHLSEPAHERCLAALHAGAAPRRHPRRHGPPARVPAQSRRAARLAVRRRDGPATCSRRTRPTPRTRSTRAAR